MKTASPSHTVPSTMQAVVIDAYGDADKLRLANIDVPPTGANEVLIRVHAAGVGIWDVMQRGGALASGDVHFPLVLGAECSGKIVRIGADVHRDDLALDDDVFTYFSGTQGAYAQYVNVKADAVVRKPDRLSYDEAAAVPVDAVTAYQALNEELHLKAGQTIFVAGASGGVGTLAVQLAHNIGATVVASTGPKNQEYVRSLGADTVVDYTSGNVVDTVRRLHPNGVDAAFDCVGGKSAKATIQTVRDGGRFVELTGEDVGSPRGITVGHVRSEASVERLTALARMFDRGDLRVFIDRTFPLAQSREAQDFVAERHVRGKVILTVDVQ
jgi:NADPH:quinone reductase-like Zn-dependent oxidoreductase